MMDKTLLNYLKEHKINFKVHKHPAVFTVAESLNLEIKEPYLHTKNLFLKDEKDNFYLVCMYAHKKLDIKELRKKLSVTEKMRFASPEELKEQLNTTPGSVSICAMIYAKNVFLIIDKRVWGAKSAGFHPNINNATLEFTHTNLEKFYNSLKCKKYILEL